MALELKDRVKVTSNTTGTGDLSLGVVYPGFQSFATAITDGNSVYYCAHNTGTGYDTEWEVGIGTYTSSTDSLSRDTVLSSSNSGSLVNFSTGTKEVFVTYPSERGVYVDVSSGYIVQSAFNNMSVAGTATINGLTLTSGTIATQPSGGTDIANKTYVDTIASTGIHVHTPVNYETPDTTGNITATYADGGTTPTWTDITGNNTLATGSAHNLSAGDVIVFGSTTNGLTAGTAYFVKSVPTSTEITLSLAYDGAEITSLTNGTGLSITSEANTGVGATLTNAGAQEALTVDGVAVSLNDRVLVYNQTNAYENGVYYVTTVGNGSTNWVLTRATDANKYAPNSSTSLGDGDYFYVTSGNTGAGESYICTTPGTIIFGTTNISFVQFSSAQVYTAGTGITINNAEISLSSVGTASTYGSASSVPVFTTNAQGQVSSVTNTAIAISNSAVSGLGTMSTQDANNVSISGGSIDGVAIGGSTASTATITTLTVNGNTTLGDASGDTITTNAQNWTFNNNVSVTGTWANLGAVTTTDINGGTIDGVTIGGASAGAITGTTITASTNFAGDLTGNVTGDVSGNAGTVTNGVYTTGTYADPAWITSLDGGKLTGTVVATNGVVTSGSYADPAWITSLDGSKVSGNISGNAANITAYTVNQNVGSTDSPTFVTLNATTVDLGNWTITESAGVLYFATGGVNKMKLDASGNLTVSGNVTAYGTV